MSKSNAVPADESVFTTCIDLPGESVQCWNPRAKKIKVVLRKHRDVLIDIAAFKGMKYEIWADESPIYCSTTKKLYGKNKRLTMLDGERCNLWISREFKGAINIGAAGRVVGRYYPQVLDKVKYDAAPTTKPIPFVIAIHNFAESAPKPSAQQSIQRAYNFDRKRQLLPGPEDKDYTNIDSEAKAVMHILAIDQDKAGIPDRVAKFIQSGGEQLTIDPGDVMTRNWIGGQIVGMGSFYSDNRAWIKELWGKKFHIQKVRHGSGTRYYLIFKGDPTLRRIFTAARYSVGNEKVLAFTAGIGRGMTGKAVGDAAKGAFKNCGLLAVAFTVAIDIAEWLKDYGEYDPKTGKPKKDFCDLFVKIGIDITKGVLTSAVTAVLLGTFVFLGVITGGIGLVVGSVVIALLVGYSIDFVDNQLGASSKINQTFRDAAKHLGRKAPNDYGKFEMEIETATQFEFGAS